LDADFNVAAITGGTVSPAQIGSQEKIQARFVPFLGRRPSGLPMMQAFRVIDLTALQLVLGARRSVLPA